MENQSICVLICHLELIIKYFIIIKYGKTKVAKHCVSNLNNRENIQNNSILQSILQLHKGQGGGVLRTQSNIAASGMPLLVP